MSERLAIVVGAGQFGPPEVLVNTIGTYHLGEALTATPDDFRQTSEAGATISGAVVPAYGA